MASAEQVNPEFWEEYLTLQKERELLREKISIIRDLLDVYEGDELKDLVLAIIKDNGKIDAGTEERYLGPALGGLHWFIALMSLNMSFMHAT